MYKVFIKNFLRNGSVVTTEEQMFSVPSINKMPIQKPVVKASEDAAENFTFTMDSDSPYYDSLLQHKTMIRVFYDGPNGTDTDIIFDGKVLSISSSTVYHTKNVTCAGYYVFFNDSYYEGKQEKFRNKMTVSDYYTAIITNHNTMIPEKAVTKGPVGVTLPTEPDRYEPTSWTQTSGLLSNLTSNYGGHMLVQSSGNTRTLVWYKYYARDLGDNNRPKVIVGKNVLDINADYSGDNIFTRVIPIGGTNSNGKSVYIDGYNGYSGKSMSVPYIRNLYTDSELTDEFHSYADYRDAETNFGVIYKTVSFSDADTQLKLWNYVKKWIKDSYFGIATSFTVKAIDLHITDSNYPKILIGECVDVTYLIVRNGTPTWETKKLVCKNVSYDLFNPENNSYTFSIPSDLLEHSKTSKKSSKAQTASASGSRKANPKGDEDKELTWHKIWQIIGSESPASDYGGTNAALSFYENGELKGTAACFDPAEIPAGTLPKNNQDKWFKASIVGKITLPGKSVKWVATSADRGVFAFEFSNQSVQNGGASPVAHWYLKEKGYSYTPSDTGLSSFDTIAQLIEKDTTAGWGGATAAASFKSNGKISGSVNKAYDPDRCTAQEAAADSTLVFSADIIGKFTLSGVTKYVAMSKEYGIFGYNSGARGIIPATHWYSRAKGLTYDNVNNLLSEENTGDVYATTDGNPDEKKTVWLKTKTLTGLGSQGELLIGIDTTSQEDTWRIQLNTPFQYTDADGVTRIADGFVSASDFRVSEIPSFKTKIGIFDIVVAGKVDAQEIHADLGELNKLVSAEIKAGSHVRAANAYFTNSYLTNVYMTNPYVKVSFGGSSRDKSMKSCLADMITIVGGTGDNAGKFKIQIPTIDESTTVESNFFNIADTQFYIDAVSAAKNTGWNGARSEVVESLPTTLTEQAIPDTNWILKIPNIGYDSGDTDYPISVSSNSESYTYSGATMRVLNVSINGKIAYRKSIANLAADNIKSGVNILGVGGTFTSDATAAASDVLYGKTAYVNGSIITGTIQSKAAQTYYTSTSTQAISAGQYLSGNQSIAAVFVSSNLAPEIIKDGEIVKVGDSADNGRIVNITGKYKGSGGGSIVPSNIQIGSYTTHDADDEPSGTPADNMKSVILGAQQHNKWFRFVVTVNDNGTPVQKAYKFKFP